MPEFIIDGYFIEETVEPVLPVDQVIKILSHLPESEARNLFMHDLEVLKVSYKKPEPETSNLKPIK
jgi:hypothetical protein